MSSMTLFPIFATQVMVMALIKLPPTPEMVSTTLTANIAIAPYQAFMVRKWQALLVAMSRVLRIIIHQSN